MAGLARVRRAAAGLALMACAVLTCAVLARAPASAAETGPRAAAARPLCLNAAETRETVKSHRLIEPFAALKFAAAQRKAEALSARLCRAGDEFVYVITLLRRDGRLVHVAMEAATGKIVPRPAREPREAREPRVPRAPQVKK